MKLLDPILEFNPFDDLWHAGCTIAKLPLAKEVDEFSFEDTPVNETLVRDLAGGEFKIAER